MTKVAILSFAHERAEEYARLLRERSDVELIAADDDRARGRRIADLLGIPVGTVDEAFAAQPDAVVVSGAPAGRRALVERAAAAGAHVLCEQPLAPAEQDAVAMIEACARAGVGLVMSGPGRCGPAFEALRRLVADGGLGTVLALDGVHTTAPVAEGLARLADLMDGILGQDPVVQVYAQAHADESAALVSVTYQSGTTAALDLRAEESAAAQGPLVSVYGTTGQVEFEPCGRLLSRCDATVGRERWETGESALYAAMLDRFVTGVRAGKHSAPDGAAGLRVLRVVLAARRSAHRGRPVALV
ncbi:Gfo/Idh/MocA family protein [Streptomyces sp. NPDC002513]